MPVHTFTFRKAEHICLKKDIEALFSAGSASMSVFPLRATYRFMPYTGNGPRAQVLLSVSKRRFKHAVDRNRAKRQIREAYRLQKQTLLGALPEGMAVHIAFIWLSERPVSSRTVHNRLRVALERIAEKSATAAIPPVES